MTRYWYSLVRCVPDPRTGEFVNVGAIAGDPESGDWAVRQVSNEARARKLATARELDAVHGLLARVGEEIDAQTSALEEGSGEPLALDWLADMHARHRNVVQLSAPMPMVADSSGAALETVFGRLIIEPTAQSRPFITKHTVIHNIRAAYQDKVDAALVKPNAQVLVGAHVHAPLDFAIANGRAVQLTQGWSFQRSGIEEVATQVKAWGYALNQLRAGEDARIIDASGNLSRVDTSVDIAVVVAEPISGDQRRVFEEATQVFRDLEANVTTYREVDAVAERAAALLQPHVPA